MILLQSENDAAQKALNAVQEQLKERNELMQVKKNTLSPLPHLQFG